MAESDACCATCAAWKSPNIGATERERVALERRGLGDRPGLCRLNPVPVSTERWHWCAQYQCKAGASR